ncbi:unnamed protein product [Urochloa humidicola]
MAQSIAPQHHRGQTLPASLMQLDSPSTSPTALRPVPLRPRRGSAPAASAGRPDPPLRALPSRRPSFLSPSSPSRRAWPRRCCTHGVWPPLQVAAAEAGAPAASAAAAPYLAVAPPLPQPAKASSAAARQAVRRPERLVLRRSSRGKRSPWIRECRAEITATQGEASGGVAVVLRASLEHGPSLLAPARRPSLPSLHGLAPASYGRMISNWHASCRFMGPNSCAKVLVLGN